MDETDESQHQAVDQVLDKLENIEQSKNKILRDSVSKNDSSKQKQQAADLAKARAEARVTNAVSFVLTAFGTAIAGAAVYSVGRWLGERVSK